MTFQVNRKIYIQGRFPSRLIHRGVFDAVDRSEGGPGVGFLIAARLRGASVWTVPVDSWDFNTNVERTNEQLISDAEL